MDLMQEQIQGLLSPATIKCLPSFIAQFFWHAFGQLFPSLTFQQPLLYLLSDFSQPEGVPISIKFSFYSWLKRDNFRIERENLAMIRFWPNNSLSKNYGFSGDHHKRYSRSIRWSKACEVWAIDCLRKMEELLQMKNRSKYWRENRVNGDARNGHS